MAHQLRAAIFVLVPSLAVAQLYPVDGVTPAPGPVQELMPICTVVPGSERCLREDPRCRGSGCLLNASLSRLRNPAPGTWNFDPRGTSVSSCAAGCWKRSLRLAAVQGQRCECGASLDLANISSLQLPMANCSGAAAQPCPGNHSELCGGPGATRLYEYRCHDVPICTLNQTTLWNGTVVSYKQYLDCWRGKDDTAVVHGAFGRNVSQPSNLSPYPSILCAVLRQQGRLTESEWWCEKAAKELRNYADGGVPQTYHGYSVVLAYHWMVNRSGLATGDVLTPAQDARYVDLVVKGCGGSAKKPTDGVENHGIDFATAQAFALYVFPQLPVNHSEWLAGPTWLMDQWFHAHALDENAIGYDAISIAQLLVLDSITPGGLADLHSEAFKQFVYEFADSITPGGMLVNHGGGLQDDGQAYPNGAFGYIYLFEVAATQFQRSDPAAASYFKWAARQIWQNFDVSVDFLNFHFSAALPWLEELKQLNATGRPIPLPADDDSHAAGMTSKVVYKNEYGHDINNTKAHRQKGHRVPKKLVVCASRSRDASSLRTTGGGYVQQDIYAVPPAWHGDAMQAGTLSHYEAGQTLFVYGGTHTKHTSQSDADTGVPTLMPFSDAAEAAYPWRYGQYNMAPGKWQRQESPVKWMSGQQNMGSWKQFWDVTMSNLALVCHNAQTPLQNAFHINLDGIALIGPGGVRVLDSFSYWNSTPNAWGSSTEWSMDTAPDADAESIPAGGRRSLRLLCTPNTTIVANRPPSARPFLNFSFDGSVYTHLRFHFMLSTEFVVNQTYGWDNAEAQQHDDYGASTYLDNGIPFQLKPLYKPFGGENCPSPTNDFIPQFDMTAASADPTTGNAHGGYRARAFGGFTADTEWTRHMVLVGGAGAGTLVVVDSIVPRGLGNGSEWLVGTPWQLNFDSNCSNADNLAACTLATAQGGDDAVGEARNWFDLTGFERTTTWHQRLTRTEPPELSLVLKLVGSGNATVGSALGYMAPPQRGFATRHGSHATPWFSWPWQTVFNRQRVVEGERALFVSVFVPYDRRKTDGVTINSKIDVTIDAAKESATVTLGSVAKRVELDIHGGWKVTDVSRRASAVRVNEPLTLH